MAKSTKFGWSADDIEIDERPNLPKRLKTIIQDLPDGDKAKAGKLKALLDKGDITSDDMLMIMATLARPSAKMEADYTEMVRRAGARHTSGEYATIQKMHDMACDLGATCEGRQVHKAGARHSIADRQVIQRIHDDCAGLGATCKTQRGKTSAMPSVRDMMTKSQSDAPNYRAASGPDRCQNCGFFKDDPGGDRCSRFDFIADQDYVCDDWRPDKPDEIPGYRRRSLTEIARMINRVQQKD